MKKPAVATRESRMVIERAEFRVIAGREQAFEEAMAEGIQILGQAAGCTGARLGRGVEDPGKFVLLLEWPSVESHIAFTKTQEMERFRALAGPFFAGRPSMEHFDLVTEAGQG